ncbi:hypothetical protein [Oxalicibacterium faecigallinarum]|uniref:HNH endonuclease n=1 Tax=Oxalicibacterium faecigallinarum TaxID=573741 RepID=A0A8J3F4Q6_9BURK|nr:hypothetical protein [Oxalicibacterium faecigallinarum]GGI17031.1 hypothetical protein GCM10008066_06930 [Oxalicibacterium faecigallinarum]
MDRPGNFSEKTKRAVAARSGWHCSFAECGRLTVGPSEEAPDASANIGEAAHICAASPGGRRYDPKMTHEQRSDINNAMWLCVLHARLIDRDEATFSVENLHTMKEAHEASCARAISSGSGVAFGSGLFAIGPNIVCTGVFTRIEATQWTLQLTHFLSGDIHQVASYISEFGDASADHKYILSNELGDGRILSAPPSLIKDATGISLLCPVESNFPRSDVQKIGSSLAISAETNDLYLDERGSIARVSGLDYLPQLIRQNLSIQVGESVFDPSFGMRIFEYFSEYSGSPWLALLFKLDMVRQASIPFFNTYQEQRNTPLRCVTRVHSFEILASAPTDNRLPIHVDCEIKGLGRWKKEMSIYMPTAEQMEERKKILAVRPPSFARKKT